MLQLQGQRVLITGASSGIGEEFARQFYAAGADLILVARRSENLEKIATELRSRPQGTIKILSTDLTQEKSNPTTLGISDIELFLQQEHVDILVNNAGRGSFGFFESLSLAEELEMVSLNIAASLRLAHAIIPQLKKRKQGAIISVSSLTAFQPLPYMATYAATKAFNFVHSLGLYDELKPFGVDVLTVCPGPTDTEFGGVARVPGKLTGVKRDSTKDVVRESLDALRLHRRYVVTGIRNKLLFAMFAIVPLAIRTTIAGRVLLSSLTFKGSR